MELEVVIKAEKSVSINKASSNYCGKGKRKKKGGGEEDKKCESKCNIG